MDHSTGFDDDEVRSIHSELGSSDNSFIDDGVQFNGEENSALLSEEFPLISPPRGLAGAISSIEAQIESS